MEQYLCRLRGLLSYSHLPAYSNLCRFSRRASAFAISTLHSHLIEYGNDRFAVFHANIATTVFITMAVIKKVQSILVMYKSRFTPTEAKILKRIYFPK